MERPDSRLSLILEDTIRRVVREELDELLGAHRAPAPSVDTYLTVAQAAKIAQACTASVRRWVKSGRLKAAHAGRHIRIHEAELHRFINSAENDEQDRVTHGAAAKAERDLARRMAKVAK